MNFRDVELLSAYLDGRLNPSDSARLESRLQSDSNLRAVLDDLRSARGLLRQLPARKAPRNFTLTRKMVGARPPLPRTYSAFRFATAFATVLLLLTFAVNGLLPHGGLLAASAPAPYGVGGGGGGCESCGGGTSESYAAPVATQAPAATEAPAPLAPSVQMGVAPTATAPAVEDNSRLPATAMPKSSGTESAVQNQPLVKNEALIPLNWQIGLFVIIFLSGLVAFMLRQSAMRKWR